MYVAFQNSFKDSSVNAARKASRLPLAIFRFCDEWRHHVIESNIGSKSSVYIFVLLNTAKHTAGADTYINNNNKNNTKCES